MAHVIIGPAIKHGFTQFPESREWFRLVSGIANTLQDYGIDNLLGAKVGSIGELAKGIDGAYYGKKAIEDIDAVVITLKAFDRANKRETLIAIFHATVKCAGDSFATLKWAGAIGGIVVLAPHAKSFGYVKNVCSVYSATVGTITAGRTFYAEYNTDPTVKNANRRKNMANAAVKITVCLCSVWLNGMGGLDSWVGGAAKFAEKGIQRLQPWTFNAAVIISNTVATAKNLATAPAD